MSRNPYAPPEADVERPTRPPGKLELAGRGRRLANYVIDVGCYFFLAVFLAEGVSEYSSIEIDNLLDGTNQYVFIIAAVLMYYIPCESLFGRTLGKLVTGTRTVTVDGRKPTFNQIMLRTMVRLLSPFDGLSILFGREPVCWHDRWSRTRVVRV